MTGWGNKFWYFFEPIKKNVLEGQLGGAVGWESLGFCSGGDLRAVGSALAMESP